jgi:hypothetical protein
MSKKLVWVTNEWAKLNPVFIHQIQGDPIIYTVEEQIKWRSQFIKGEPQATKQESVASLKAMGVIGLYKEVEE